MIKKIFALLFMFLAFLVFSFGYESGRNNKYEFSIDNQKQIIASFNSIKEIGNDYITKISERTKEYWNKFTDFQNINFNLDFDLGVGVNILNILYSTFTIIFVPIKLLLTGVLIFVNFLTLTFYYGVLASAWALSLGGAL